MNDVNMIAEAPNPYGVVRTMRCRSGSSEGRPRTRPGSLTNALTVKLKSTMAAAASGAT